MRYFLPEDGRARVWSGGWAPQALRLFIRPSGYPVYIDGIAFTLITGPITEPTPGVYFSSIDGYCAVTYTGIVPEHTNRWTHFGPLDPEKQYVQPRNGIYVGNFDHSMLLVMALEGRWYKLSMHRDDSTGKVAITGEQIAIVVGTRLKLVTALNYELRLGRGVQSQEGAIAPDNTTPQHEE